MDYKLEQLKEMSRVKYTIDFRLTKKDNEWELDDLTILKEKYMEYMLRHKETIKSFFNVNN